MATFVEQWDAILASQPDDWSTMELELRLRDANQSEESALVLSPLNPWRDGDWRSGAFRFRATRAYGYGTAAELCRKRLGTLDELGIRGTLRPGRRLSAIEPVATQGPLI